MEDTSGRESRAPSRGGRVKRSWRPLNGSCVRKRHGYLQGRRQGCQRFGPSGTKAEENAPWRRQSKKREGPAEADRSVVKRTVLRQGVR